MILPTHTFIHFLKDGQRLEVKVFREEGKMPSVSRIDTISLNDLDYYQQLEYAVWVSYYTSLLMTLLTKEEINLLAKYGHNFLKY